MTSFSVAKKMSTSSQPHSSAPLNTSEKSKPFYMNKGKSDILVLSKIENRLGVENFDTIVQISDGIMVARGDLGVELPIQEVPVLQKMMIRKCVQAAKPVVTATQMLESMIDSPRPTRAESSDVANAIYDSTSAVMLSGETAVGKYPIQTVKLMRQIVEAAEEDFHFEEFFSQNSRIDSHDISTSIALASVKTAYSLGATAIFAYTSTGSTARLISRFRPAMPIVALTQSEKTYHQLAFSWGVVPVPPQTVQNAQEALRITSQFAREHNLVHFGDLVVVTAGTPFGLAGSTNMIIVESIGEVLVRGHVSEGKKVVGKIKIVVTADAYTLQAASGKIVVLSKFDESMGPIAQKAKGIILQNHPEDEESEEAALKEAERLNIPIIFRADEALRRLSDGQTVTMDPQKGTIYKKHN
jgi:pyruvate kinase